MKRYLPHIRIFQPTDTIKFTSTLFGGSDLRFPERDREKHAQHIQQELEQAWKESENEIAVTHPSRTGIYIEFESASGFDIAIKSLEDLRKGIRLCNVRQKQGDAENNLTNYVTTYIPNDQKHVFFDKIEAYLTAHTENGHPKNKPLIEGIEHLRKALLVDSFWTEEESSMPRNNEKKWCEIWLRTNDKDTKILEEFDQLLKALKLDSKADIIKFPERAVRLVCVSKQDLCNLSKHSDHIAEYRKAKTTANFLLSQTPADQNKWTDNLVQRTTVDKNSNISICLLDTGVNNGHPLISNLLDDSDCQSVKPEWGVHDHGGHGTLMAGLLGYGNLQEKLEMIDSVAINHRLESVKILHPKEENPVELWGDFTKQAISRAEIQASDRKRIICMAVSADDTRNKGKPSSWSAAIDQITSGAEDDKYRLTIVAAGNADQKNWKKYPVANITDAIHDPAQSWNALTVGAITFLQEITDPDFSGYTPLAKKGELSPFTTTSMTWEKQWPIKPEVVFEGGNLAIDKDQFASECQDLSLISTCYKPTESMLSSFNMTSAATAQAAHFAACIQSHYPDYWPETIRGLIVHSAQLPEAAEKELEKKSKKEIECVLRIYGYGMPNLDQALYCASNSLTLIMQSEIQPFEKNGNSPKTKDMHLYELPWPKEILEGLGETKAQMKITLSYFVEPGPGEIGWKDRYRYASHALHFDLNAPEEDRGTFIKRINKQAREENEEKPDTSSPTDHWVIGTNNRNKGSIHSDIWKGTAAQLASSNLIAISPRIGWWKERSYLERYDRTTRYSLIVSILTPSNEVDIYTPVQIKLSQSIPTIIERKNRAG